MLKFDKRFHTNLIIFFLEIKDDVNFQKHQYYSIAKYFKDSMTLHGYCIRPTKWESTKRSCRELQENNNCIPISEWKECIDWAFSDERMLDQFWGKVTVSSFSTVIKMFDTFKTIKVRQLAQNKVVNVKPINYGKLR